jgi:GNAT superfamily N-acetyltransferase
MSIDVQPVTAERWGDLLALFGERGASAGCWCMWFRKPPHRSNEIWSQNRVTFQGLVMDDRVPGLLAYRDGEPVGWVSVAPRPEFGRIVGPGDEGVPGAATSPIWSIVCFYIQGRKRGTGIATALLDAAVEHARNGGAEIIEAYPVEPEGRRPHNGDAFTGLRSMFERAGFSEIGRFDRWFDVPSIGDGEIPVIRKRPGRPVMQLRLGKRRAASGRQAAPGAVGPGMPRRVSSAPKPSRSSTPT